MAFSSKKYSTASVVKPLPVFLLLDVSGSMDGEKIDSLFKATKKMIKAFKNEKSRETDIQVAIITFGREGGKVHTPMTPVENINEDELVRFVADGYTPMGEAFKITKEMIEDREIIPSRVYTPSIVLVSDGMPNDEWKEPMEKLVNEGRSKKCQRFAVAVEDMGRMSIDMEMLRKFIGNDDESAIIKASENVEEIVNAFKKITMTITSRASSRNPDEINSVASSVLLDDGFNW